MDTTAIPAPVARLLRQLNITCPTDWELAKDSDSSHAVKAYQAEDPAQCWEEIRSELQEARKEPETPLPAQIKLQTTIKQGTVAIAIKTEEREEDEEQQEEEQKENEHLTLEVTDERAVQITAGDKALTVKEAGDTDEDTKTTHQVLWDGSGNIIFPDIGTGFKVPPPVAENLGALLNLAEKSGVEHNLPSEIQDNIVVPLEKYTPSHTELVHAATLTDPFNLADSVAMSWADLFAAYSECAETDLTPFLDSHDGFREQLVNYPKGSLVEVHTEQGWLDGYVDDMEGDVFTVRISANDCVLEDVGVEYLRPKLVHVSRRKDLKRIRLAHTVTHVNTLPLKKFEKHYWKIGDTTESVDWWVRIEGDTAKPISEIHDRISVTVTAVRLKSEGKPELNGVYKKVEYDETDEWVKGNVRISPLTGWWTVIDESAEHILRSKKKISKNPGPEVFCVAKWYVSDEVAYHSDWVPARGTSLCISDVSVKKHPQANLGLGFEDTDNLLLTSSPDELECVQGTTLTLVDGVRVKSVMDVHAETRGKKHVLLRFK